MSVQSILRSVIGLALGLDRNDNLVLGGSKIYYYNETASKAGNVDLANGAAWVSGAISLPQGGLPRILQSSGTMGANGALSAITALPNTYPHCYLRFPAGKAYSGSAAGFYYTEMSSTTAGTVFNNIYVSGTATIPTTKVPIVDAGPGAYTQDTATTTSIVAHSFSIPANGMGLVGKMEMQAQLSFINNANSKGYGYTFGGTTIMNGNLNSAAGTGFFSSVSNQGAPNVQFADNGTQGDFVGYGNLRYPTVDTTAAVTVNLFLNLATATDYIVLETVSPKLFPN